MSATLPATGTVRLTVNGRPVEDWDTLLDAVETLPLGSTVELLVLRDGRKLRIPLRLEAARD